MLLSSLTCHRPCRAALALAFLALAAAPSRAQLAFGGLPASAAEPLSDAVPTYVAPATPELLELMRAEDERAGHWPLRYGALIPVAVGITSAGRIDLARDGALVWRARLVSPGAFSIGLEFDRWRLPEGGRLFVYDDARSTVLGAFDHRNNKENGELQIQPLRGDAVVVEYVQDPLVAGLPELSIRTVIHDYRDVLTLIAGEGGEEGDCLVDVNCPDASAFQDEKHAVARTFAGGGLCTGALLNNTAQDGTQYFLTANHCGSMTNAVFTFNYETSGCGTGFAPQNQSVAGSVLLVTDSTEDFRLVRITEPIPASYDPYFAGWKKSAGAPSTTASITHPSGGPKKFTRDLDPATASTPFWTVVWETGMLLGGSSGGPLFSGQGYVMGPACCVSEFECGVQTAFFGRLDLFWDDVEPWLDPLGNAPNLFPGLDPDDPPPPVVPNLVSANPSQLPAVGIDGFPTVTLTGTGLAGVTALTVDGIALTSAPPEFAVLNDTQIAINAWPYVDQLGAVSVAVTSPGGSDSLALTVVENAPPALELVGSLSEGGFLSSTLGLDLTLGSGPGDVHFLAFSGSSLPSSLPGFVDYGIGNNFFSLFGLGSWVVPAAGWIQVLLPLSGNLAGVTVHFQSAVVDVSTGLVFPLVTSNVQSGQFLR